MNDIQVYQVRRKEKEKERPLFTRGVEGCEQFWGFVINYSACPKQTFLTSTFLCHVMVHPVLALFRSLGMRLTLCSQTPVIFIWEYLVDEWMSTKWGGGMWTILKPCLVYYLSKKLTISTQYCVHLEVVCLGSIIIYILLLQHFYMYVVALAVMVDPVLTNSCHLHHLGWSSLEF